MPEEFPSNEDIAADPASTGSGGGAGASGVPLLPGGNGDGSGPDVVDDGAAPDGAAGSTTGPAINEPPSSGGENAGPADAGVDAAVPSADDSDSAGETAP